LFTDTAAMEAEVLLGCGPCQDSAESTDSSRCARVNALHNMITMPLTQARSGRAAGGRTALSWHFKAAVSK
jgi:hypothetical protein